MNVATPMPHGQSHQTTLAQIAADEFGVPFEQVRIVVGDTDVVPFGLTGGSRSATMTGGAALHGARRLKDKVLDFAAHLMEASARDLLITDGNVWVRGDPASAITVSEIARQAASGQFSGADVDANLEVEAAFDGGEGGWSGGSHCAIVEIDVETGLVTVERTSPLRIAARSSTLPSSRARSEAASRKASARCCSNDRLTTKTATSSRPRSWTTCCRPPVTFHASR